MNWEYFKKNNLYRFKRFPKPQKTVKIKDVSDNLVDEHTLKEIKEFFSDSNEYNEYWKKEYIGLYINDYFYDIEIEGFWEYCNRNPYRFLGKQNYLKGVIDIVEDLYYWYKFDENGTGTPTLDYEEKEWKILWITGSVDKNIDYIDDKIHLKFKELGLIEVRHTTKKNYLIEFINDSKVSTLIKIAHDNNIVLKGKKQEKIDILIESVEGGLIKNTSLDIYKPTEEFYKWINKLVLKYIELIERALETFDYPNMYIASVWKETIFWNGSDDIPLIKSIVETRQKKYLKLLDDIKLKKMKEDERQINSGEKLIINNLEDVNKEKIKKASFVYLSENADDNTKKLYKETCKKIYEDEITEEYELEERERKKEEKEKSLLDKIEELNAREKKFLTYSVLFIIFILVNLILKI